MGYLDLHSVGTHGDFVKIVGMAMITKAASVAGENNALLSDNVLSKRQALANKVFADTLNQAKLFALHIATYGGSTLSIDTYGELVFSGANIDLAIDNLMDTVWNDRAGVTYAELNPA